MRLLNPSMAHSLALAAIATPFLGSLLSLLLAALPTLGERLAKLSSVLSAYLTFGVVVALALLAEAPLLDASRGALPLELRVDALSTMPALLTSLVSALALTFNAQYLSPSNKAYRVGSFNRSYPAMLAFMGSMLGLLFSDNAISLLAFWGLASLCTYALMTFRLDPESLSAGLKYLVLTHVGSVALLAAIALLYSQTRSLRLSTYSVLAGSELSSLALALAMLATLPKAVQYPFHTWLPSGVVAPTSAAVLFYACSFQWVYLIIRFLQLLTGWQGSSVGLSLALTSIGAATTVVGGISGLAARNVKRVVAYGAISGLGLIVLAVGLPTPLGLAAGLLLLMSYALCFPLLFFIVGSVIYSTGVEEVDRLGGLYHDMRVTAVLCFIATLALVAIPSTPEFVGKYLLFQAVADAGYLHLLPVVLVGSLLSAAIGVKVLYSTFLGSKREGVEGRDPPPLMLAPTVAASLLLLVIGTYPQLAVERLVLPALNHVGRALDPTRLRILTGFLPLVPALAAYAAALVLLCFLATVALSRAASGKGEEAEPFLCGEEVSALTPSGSTLCAPLLSAARLERIAELMDPDRFYSALSKACALLADRLRRLSQA